VLRTKGARPLFPFSFSLSQFSEWSEVQIEVFVGEAKVLLEPLDLFGQPEEGLSDAFGFCVGERSAVDPAERLPLQQFPEQLDQRQHELGQAVADIVRAAPDPNRAVVGLKNHGVTITGLSLEEIFERVGGKLIQPVPMS